MQVYKVKVNEFVQDFLNAKLIQSERHVTPPVVIRSDFASHADFVSYRSSEQ